MKKPNANPNNVQVNVRIRPLTEQEIKANVQELELSKTKRTGTKGYSMELTTPKTENDDIEFVEVLGSFRVPKSKPQRQKKFSGFAQIAPSTETNRAVFASMVQPFVDKTLNGKTSCCFAYGHTGSGKTHTILGSQDEEGMYHRAAVELFQHLEGLNESLEEQEEENQLMVQVRFGEIYNNEMYDLLNHKAKCFIREDADGKVQVRRETQTDATTGLVTSDFSTSLLASTPQELQSIVQSGIAARATGSSDVHRHSSRSHAILEFEIVSPKVVDLRQQVKDLESELTPLGYERDDLAMAIFYRTHYLPEEGNGRWIKNPNASSTNEECHKLKCLRRDIESLELKIKAAKEKAQLALETHVALGGTLVFVDLAGSEHTGNGGSSQDNELVKTEQEQKECREINKSLSALRACFGTVNKGLRSNSCFRQSKLTQLLRDHFRSPQSSTCMIATISPSENHCSKTIHTLQYAQTVARC